MHICFDCIHINYLWEKSINLFHKASVTLTQLNGQQNWNQIHKILVPLKRTVRETEKCIYLFKTPRFIPVHIATRLNLWREWPRLQHPLVTTTHIHSCSELSQLYCCMQIFPEAYMTYMYKAQHKRTQHCWPTTPSIVGSYCVRLQGAKSLTGFRLCATTPNSVQ